MNRKHTYCFRYYNSRKDLCYDWIESYSLDGAKIKFEHSVKNCWKIIDIQETFNW